VPITLLYNIAFAFEGVIHWIITQSYIKVACETKQILDKAVIFNNPAKIAEVHRFKIRIRNANIVCPLLVIVLSVCGYIGGQINPDGWLYIIGAYGWLALVFAFTAVWGWMLYKLYRDTLHSRKLLPDKRIFILHGVLLVLFLALTLVSILTY